ncbi:hypothetical protein [Streptomyces sp. NPDC085596]|uniref:hypothetical protein n=1 Tax=Streptomyces sp. NPDC085596 TaxID=3365731 RepID=UPI0037D778B4
MPDVHIKLSDGVSEVSVDVNGSTDDSLDRAEATALRLFAVVVAASPPARRAGFGGWALASDSERHPEE